MLNSGEGDIAAARLIAPVGPTTELEDQSPVSFTRALYRTEPVLVQQDAAPSTAGEGTEKALAPRPADPLPEVDINARRVTKPSQLAGQTVSLPERSAYRRTLVELSDEISGYIYVADLKEAEFKNLKVRPVLCARRSSIHRDAEKPGPNSRCRLGHAKKFTGPDECPQPMDRREEEWIIFRHSL